MHEIIDYVWLYHARPMTPFVRYPEVAIDMAGPTQLAKFTRWKDAETRFSRLLHRNVEGIITGVMESGRGHCVAWDGQNIYDPRGYVYPYTKAESIYKFNPDAFWMFGGLDVSPFTVLS
jgi:hypothetical protein